jgi:hypothetical protein
MFSSLRMMAAAAAEGGTWRAPAWLPKMEICCDLGGGGGGRGDEGNKLCLVCTGEWLGENWVGLSGEVVEEYEYCDPPYWLASLLLRLSEGVVRREKGDETPDDWTWCRDWIGDWFGE